MVRSLSEGEPMKKALLVGINSYTTQKKLRGCVRDALDMADVLESIYHFDQLIIRTDHEVTKDSFIQLIENTLAPVPGESDGVRVIYFAGHGGRVYDSINGDEIDRIDENLCMPNYNALDSSTYLVDDEFALILKNAYESATFLHMYVILDSCHSGTATRDVLSSKEWKDVEAELLQSPLFGKRNPLDTRFVMDADLTIPKVDLVAQTSVSREATDPPGLDGVLLETIPVGQIGGSDPVTHLLLSGCDSQQTCKDVPIDGGYHGIFTKTLTEALRLQTNATWQEIQGVVNAVISKPFNQSPQIEGPATMKSLPVFT